MAINNWLDGTADWTVSANWSDGLPTADDAVVIATGQPQVTSAVGTVSSVANSAQLLLRNAGELTVTNAFTNTGQLFVDAFFSEGGADLTIGGTLTNSNSIAIGNGGLSANTTVTATALSNTGTIGLIGSATGQATLDVNAAAGFGSAGVLTGTVHLTGDSLIGFDSGQITSIAASSELSLVGADARIANATDLSTNSALTGLTSNAGNFYLENGASLSTTAGLTNSGSLRLDLFFAEGGANLTVGGTLTNSNLITIGNTGLSADSTITAAALDNTGTIQLTGTAANQATLDVNSAAGFGTAGVLSGTVHLFGNTLLSFDSGQITSIAASSELRILGTDAHLANASDLNSNSALTTLASNAGNFYLEEGATLTTTVGLTNTNDLRLDLFFGQGGSSLTVGGTLTNTDFITIGNTGLDADSTITANGLDNTGSIELIGSVTNQATLDVNSAAGFGAAGVLSGTVHLFGNTLLAFDSGQITSIAGSSELRILGTDAHLANASDLNSNSALTTLASNAGNFYLEEGATLTTAVGLTNTNDLRLDLFFGQGGSSLTVGGTLTNTDFITIGNTGLDADSAITATALDNTGTIQLTGSATNQATLDINSAAGFGTAGVLTGTVHLFGNTLLAFDSGQITSIASGAQLRISSADAHLANASNLNTNSALVGLTGNGGVFGLENGASVTTTGALTNAITGQIFLDNFFAQGGSSLTVGGALDNDGFIQVGNDGLSAATNLSANSLVNDGSIFVRGSGSADAMLDVAGATTGTNGVIELFNDAVADLGGAVGATQTVDFNGTDSTLILGSPESFNGSITNFVAGNTIEFSDEIITAMTYSGSTLTVTTLDGDTNPITLTGTFTSLAATPDGGSGSEINVITSPYDLTATRDVVLFISGANTVNGTDGTLDATDNLAGAGSDTLALTGGGIFDLAALTGFTGFSQVTLDNSSSVLTLRAGTPISVIAGTGNDIFIAGTGAFTSAHQINGGGGNDTLLLNGDYSAGVVFDAATITNIDQIVVSAGNSYSLTMNDANLPSGQILTVTASGLGAANSLTFNGSAETEGTLVLIGGAGGDSLTAGAGNDSLDGRAGADAMAGGGGNDTYIVDNAGDTIAEASGGGTDLVQSSVTYTLAANVDNLTLTGTAAINGTGNGDANTIVGNSGANVLSGLGDNDTLTGFGGNDRLDGGAGADTMAGGNGDDTYVVDNAGDVVSEASGSGVDLVQSFITFTLGTGLENLALTGTAAIDGTGNSTANAITGNSGANTLSGLGGNDTLTGFGGNDRLDGGAGADAMSGGNGNDTYIVDNAGDTVSEASGSGVDTVQSSITFILGTGIENLTLTGAAAINGTGNASANAMTGNSGANTLSGLGGNDTLTGFGGNDTLNGGTGADAMTGGNGNDTYVVDNAGDTVSEASGSGIDLVQSSVTFTLGSGLENLTLTGTAAINGIGNSSANAITGNSGANTLSGLGGNDTLTGFGGNDRLDGGTGADAMAGGNGDDTYVVDNAGDTASESGGSGIDLVQSSVTFTLGSGLENLTLTGTAAINGTGNASANAITGNSAANTLSGLAGNDTFTGFGGNDRLDGGTGADTMIGGNGNDTYVVDNAGDTASESGGSGIDLVQSSVTFTLGTGLENLTLTGAAAINGTGNASANAITGNSAANVLSGLAGNDTLTGFGGNDRLDGGTGADTMIGGNGNDTYVVDNAGDTASEAGGSGVDLVQSTVSFTLAAGIENLALGGAAAINGTGSASANIISGNSAVNRLDGNAGNDTLTGFGGADVFVFDDGDGDDTITDFANGSDTFDLTAVAGVDEFSDLTVIDNGPTVTVDYGTGSFTLANIGNPALIDASDFVFA